MIMQRTVKAPVTIEGIGLQTGNKVTLKLKPSPAGSGINFIRTDLPNRPLLNLQSMATGNRFSFFERRTTVGVGPLQIQTTEHILAALSGLGIDNIVIELDNVELPGLDGSAKGFLDILKKAGIEEQGLPKKFLEVKETLECRGPDNSLTISPCDKFRVSYKLSYKNPALGEQFLELEVDEKSFASEIAPARTFCLEEEAGELLKRGLGKGANYDNTLVMGAAGPVNTTLRFPDEPLRHKILDLIGDLYLLGMPVRARVVAVKSGHKLNMELVRKLKELEAKWK